MTSPKRALVVMAEDAEEMEVVTPVDILRRADIEVTLAGLTTSLPVKCSRGVRICPDTNLAEVASQVFDVVILPGGLLGSQNLAASEQLRRVLSEQFSSGRIVASICAASTAFHLAGIPAGTTLTSYPTVSQQLKDAGYDYSEDRVVVCGNVVTSRAPGTALEWALKLVELLVGAEKAQEVGKRVFERSYLQ